MTSADSSYVPRIHYAARFFEGDGFVHPRFIYVCAVACGEEIPLAGANHGSRRLTMIEDNVTCEACLDAAEAGIDPFARFLDRDDPRAKHLYEGAGKTPCGLTPQKGRKRKGDPPRVPSLTVAGGQVTCRECARYIDAAARESLAKFALEGNPFEEKED